MMRIAVASGKGGTGKTTVATSLALSIADEHGPLLILDCDVESPNVHLFLHPSFEAQKEVGILLPVVDESRCSHCGRCAEVCQFNAIVILGEKTVVFPQLCHGCGSCTLVCPEQAIKEELGLLGTLEAGPTPAGPIVAQGKMNVGEMLAVPIIRDLKNWPWRESLSTEGTPLGPETRQPQGELALFPDQDPPPWQTIILDAPPGTSCPVVETVRGSDFVLLVTEPTPFGLHDLRLMAQVVRELKIPAGVIVNRDGIGKTSVDQFCAQAGLPVLMRIPLRRDIAVGIAQGLPLITICPEMLEHFRHMAAGIRNLVLEATP
jgi:MinD superfamily P-loop ATPase